MIPLLGIPVLNRGDLLLRCIRSIDYPVGVLLVVNNGADPSVQRAREEIEADPPKDTRAFVWAGPSMNPLHHQGNRGVAGSWNMIASYGRHPYVLVVGSDILFQPGDLQTFDGFVTPRAETHVEIYGNHGHSCFAITPLHQERVGTFDENFYPAYLEDCDDSRRIYLTGSQADNCPGVRMIHGEGPRWGSSTIHSDAHYSAMNGITHGNNFTYYRRKWGGDNGGERYTAPFNDPEWPIRRWELDLEHRRQNSIW